MKKVLLIVVVLLAVLFISFKVFQRVTLDEDLTGLLEKGAVMIDVRTPEEFEAGHLKGAVNVPLKQMKEGPVDLNHDQAYITYCDRGIRSFMGKKLLKAQGYE